MPLDPGEHEVIVSAPGKKMWSQRVQLGPGAVNSRIEVPALEQSLTPQGAAPGPVPESASGGIDAPTSKPLPLRTIGFVGLGAGAIGIGVGAVTGIMAVSKHSDLQKACGGNICGPQQESERQSYYTLGTVSTAATVAGAALAGGGLVMVLVAPKSKPTSTTAWNPIVGPASFGVRGSF
jgi:hypothetical protein